MTEFLSNHVWVGGVFVSGYLIRWAHTLWRGWVDRHRSLRLHQLRARDQAEVTRILTGLDSDEPTTLLPPINSHLVSRSPMVKSRIWTDLDQEDHLPATVWERAVIPYSDDETAWLNTPHRGLRQWWDDMWQASKPRTPQQVALEAYETAVLMGGETYTGHHRADGYTPRQVYCLNTHTAEFPSLRYLRTGWRNTSSLLPAEVLT